MLETLHLNVGTANGKVIPTEGKPLAKYVHGHPAYDDLNYGSVVGMFLYHVGQK